jgi:MGT family glycosyltransferase
MPKILFLIQPTIGHLNALLSIALQMREEGHSVRFLVPGIRWKVRTGIRIFDTGQEVPARIARHGLAVDVLPPHPSLLWDALRLPRKSGYAETSHAFRMFFKGMEHYARHVLKHIEKHRPHALVTDFAFPAAGLAAESAGIPYAAVYHSGLPFRGAGIPPFGSGLPIGGSYSDPADEHVLRETRLLEDIDSRVARARRAFGLPPAGPDLLRRPYSPWLNLVASAPILEAPRDNLTANTIFVGPCLSHRVEEGFPFERLRSDKFKVYVSLGTVFNDRPEVFRKILRSLAAPDYQVIVSAGGAFEALAGEALPVNASVYRAVPQIGMLERIDLFISHGGNNSTNEALAAGKPLLVLPVGGEQADNASRIVYLGVGKRMDIADFTETQLLDLVEELRRNPAFRRKTAAIRDGLKPFHGTVTASRYIAWMAERKRPCDFGVPKFEEGAQPVIPTEVAPRTIMDRQNRERMPGMFLAWGLARRAKWASAFLGAVYLLLYKTDQNGKNGFEIYGSSRE